MVSASYGTVGRVTIVAVAIAVILFFIRTHGVGAQADWFIAGSLLLLLAGLIQNGDRLLLLTALCVPVCCTVLDVANLVVAQCAPHTLDNRFNRIDFGASVALYHWTLAHPLIANPLTVAYDALPFIMAASLVLSDKRRAFLRCMVIAGVMAPVCYLLMPAVGPAHRHDLLASRNCMPSLHVTWALLCCLWIGPRFRSLGVVFVLATACAVIGTGEHYLIDVLAAIPYTVLVLTIESGKLPLRQPALRGRHAAKMSPSLAEAHDPGLRRPGRPEETAALSRYAAAGENRARGQTAPPAASLFDTVEGTSIPPLTTP